jgi:hypothetical protein
MKNPTRATKLEDLAMMNQEHSRHERLPHHRQIEEKLAQLQMFVGQLAATEQGRLDLEERARVLGPFTADPADDAATTYGKLRNWLDKDLSRAPSRFAAAR